MDQLLQLIHALALIVGVHILVLGPEVAPLEAVDGPEVIDLSVSEAEMIQERPAAIAFPNFYVLFPTLKALLEQVAVGLAFDEPEQLLDDASPEHIFRGHEREGLAEVVPHQAAKERQRAGLRAVGLEVAFVHDFLDHVQVLHFFVDGHGEGQRAFGINLIIKGYEIMRVGFRSLNVVKCFLEILRHKRIAFELFMNARDKQFLTIGVFEGFFVERLAATDEDFPRIPELRFDQG